MSVRFDTYRFAVKTVRANPTIDPATIVSDQVALAVDRFDQMKVIGPANTHQYDIANDEVANDTRFQRDAITVVDAPCHRMTTRSHLYRLSIA